MTLKRNIPKGMIICFFWLMTLPAMAASDDLPGQTLKGFRYPDYDNQGQLKMEVSGDRARFLPQDLIQITNLRMTFYEEGKTVMHISTPLCFFDRIKHTAASTSEVCVTRAEIIITGRGFKWNEKDGCRINSNVRVILQKTDQKSYLGAEGAAPVSPAALETDTNNTVITSTRLAFDPKKSTVMFEGRTVVTDPALKIESDRLTVLLSNDKKVELIKAEGNVIITKGIIQAMAQMASYAIAEGKITLSGRPCVIRQRDSLTAESIVLWRSSNRIICEPQAHLTIYSDQKSQDPLKND